MNDTLLRDRLQLLIAQSMTNYSKTTAKHNELLHTMHNKNQALKDLHQVLKITRTLPLLEKYQKDALPSTNSMEGYVNQLNKTLNLADTLTKK